MFGSTSGFSFGASPAASITGTTVKFNAVSGTDQVAKNGVPQNINTLHQCITAMKEYESKSIEELRYEDYQANRKQGTSSTTSTTSGLFGSTQPTTGGLFGSSSTPGSTSLFGASKPATTSLFGSTPSSTASTSLFGASKPATSSIFGSGTTGTTSGFSFGTGTTAATASPSTGGLFGSSTAPKTSIFGTPTSTTGTTSGGLFGSTQPASTPSTGLFGSSTGAFGSTTTTTQPSTGGLFGSTTQPAFGGFGTTTTQPSTGFGFGTTTTTSAPSSFGGFGATTTTTAPKPAGFGSPFGTTTTSTASPFGTTAPTTSLFGSTATTQSKPLFGTTTTTTGFGGFGTQPSTSTASTFGGFGTTPGTTATTTPSVGLFGATQPATQPSTTTQPFSFGGFGSTQPTSTAQPASTGFGGFGSSTTSGFGTTTSGFGGFGSGSTGTGLGTTTGSGLFGASQPSSLLSTTGGALGTGGLGTSSTQPSFSFGLGTQAPSISQQTTATQPQPLQQQMQALINSPYGSSPLFKNIITDFDKKEEILKPVNPVAQRSFMADTTNITAKGGLSQTVKLTPKSLNIKPVQKSTSLFEGLEEEEEVPAFMPRKNIKKLLFKPQDSSRRSSTTNSIASGTGGGIDKRDTDFLHEPTTLGDDKVKNFLSDKKTTTTSYLDDTVKYYITNQQKDTNDYSNISEDDVIEQQDEIEHPAKVVLRRPDYFTIPSLDELAKLFDQHGDCLVENFSIARIDYGCITFPGITNVANMNLDEIVHIRRKEVNIYPDESKKPVVGQGLNKPAEVTLHGVWPLDKKTKMPITEPQRIYELGFNKKLEKATLEMDAEFIDYDMQTGSWTFAVKHFSKYGLDDSDDENEVADDNESNEKKDYNNMLSRQLKLIETRRLELAQRKKLLINNSNATNSKMAFLNNLDLVDDNLDIDRASCISNKENQKLYPDITKLSTKQTGRLYPNLDMFDMDQDEQRPPKMNLLNNLDNEVNKDEIIETEFEPKTTLFRDTDDDQQNLTNRFYSANYDKSNRSKKLANAFFDDEMECEDKSLATSIQTQKYGLNGILLKNEALSGLLSDTKTIETESTVLIDEDGASHPPKYPKLIASTSIQSTQSLQKRVQNELKKLDIKYVKISKEYIPLNKSLLNNRFNLIGDSALFNSKRFKVSFTHPCTFTSLNVMTDKITKYSTHTLVQLKQLQINNLLTNTQAIDPLLGNNNSTLKENCEFYLNIQYKYTDIQLNNDNIPHCLPKQGNSIIKEFSNVTQELRNKIGSHPDADNIDHMLSVWSLCESLWGNIEELEINKLSENSLIRYELDILRKKELSKWLTRISTHRIEREVKLCKYNHNSKNIDNNYLNGIYSLLTGNKLFDACQLAIENNDYRLSLLLTQISSNRDFNELLTKQLDNWTCTKSDKYINLDRLRLYVLLSGKLTYDTNNNKVNVCDNLDWKRQFALHLWYNCLPINNIQDALVSYEHNVTNGTCARPYPPHLEDSVQTNKREEIFDTCYHLIKLYCDKTHNLNDLLSPLTHTSNRIDYRLSWHLALVLKSLEYKHISEYSLDNLHDNFAAQLQTLDLWHWSVFVLLHINDTQTREKKIRFYLNKNCTSNLELNEKEQFTIEKLRIPNEWVFEAKALRANYEFKHDNQVELLIKAKKFNKAHDLLINELASDYLIKNKYDTLLKYLLPLSHEHEKIHKWFNGGKVYIDFIKLNDKYQHLIKYKQLDQLDIHDNITNLANLIKNFDISSVKKRQSCLKISKLLLNLFYIFIDLSDTSNFKLNDGLLDKAAQQTDLCSEHDLIDKMRILKSKYMYNALKLKQPILTL